MVKRFRSMTYPYIAWIIAIIVVPMLLIVLYAFTTSGNSVLTFQFTFENFALVLQNAHPSIGAHQHVDPGRHGDEQN